MDFIWYSRSFGISEYPKEILAIPSIIFTYKLYLSIPLMMALDHMVLNIEMVKMEVRN